MAKDKIILVGDYTWQQARAMVITILEKCRTEDEFTDAMLKICSGVGTPEHLIKTRERLGLDVKELKKQIREKRWSG